MKVTEVAPSMAFCFFTPSLRGQCGNNYSFWNGRRTVRGISRRKWTCWCSYSQPWPAALHSPHSTKRACILEMDETKFKVPATSLALLCNKNEDVLAFQDEHSSAGWSTKSEEAGVLDELKWLHFAGNFGFSSWEGLLIALQQERMCVLHDAFDVIEESGVLLEHGWEWVVVTGENNHLAHQTNFHLLWYCSCSESGQILSAMNAGTYQWTGGKLSTHWGCEARPLVRCYSRFKALFSSLCYPKGWKCQMAWKQRV